MATPILDAGKTETQACSGCTGLAYGKCSVNAYVVGERQEQQSAEGWSVGLQKNQVSGRRWGLVSQVLMVPPDLEPFFLWLGSWKMAGKTGQSLCRLCEEMCFWLSGPSLFPSHLRSPGSHGECCVELWEHLGVDPEIAMTPGPSDSAESKTTWPDLSWEAPFLEVEISVQRGLGQPSLGAGL